MDVISLGKAMKAKKAMKALNDRLGAGVKDIYADVKTRITAIEAKNPGVTLYNRVGEIEKNTAVNLNKHNLHINAVLNKSKFGLTDLVFDDFADASGMDATKSSGHTFDSVGKKFTIASGQTTAILVTTAESLPTVPQMATVSQVFNEQLTGSKPVDLSGGTIVDAEVVNGKIQLKLIESIDNGYTDDVTAIMTNSNIPSPNAVSANTYYTTCYPWKAFDKKLVEQNSYWYTYPADLPVGGHWLKYDFGSGNKKQIQQISLITELITAGVYGIKNWEFYGSNDDITYTQLTSGTHPNVGTKVVYPFINNTEYRYYRLNVLGSYHPVPQYVLVTELEMMESAVQNFYSPLGFYESPIIDCGDNFKSLNKVENTLMVPVDTIVNLYTATSTDGITFSTYLPLNTDGTIASTSGRYIKIKVELIGNYTVNTRTINDFIATEVNQFQPNNYLILDGSAHMKVNYNDVMTVDPTFTDTGTLLKKTINKVSFKSIEKVEVI